MNWSSTWDKIDQPGRDLGLEPIKTELITVDWGDQRYYSLKDNGGNYQNVECWIVGMLIVHRSINVDERGWRVSHIPTLAKCDKIVPYGLHTRDALRNWCKTVQELYPDDWTVLNKLTCDDFDSDELTDDVLDAKERLIENCRKVKVE